MGVNNPAERFPGLGAQASRVDQGQFTPVIPDTQPRTEPTKPPKKPGRGKRILVGGATVLGLGGLIGGAAIIANGNQTEPGITPTTPATGPVTPGPDGSPTPTQSPEPTLSPTPTETPPEIIIEPTGSIRWNHENAPLGYLATLDYFDDVNYNADLVTGILIEEKEKYTKINGEKTKAWFIKVHFGNHQGREIIGSFLLGRNSDELSEYIIGGGTLPEDPATGRGPDSSGDESVVNLIQQLEIGKQYAFHYITEENISFADGCEKLPWCGIVEEGIKYKNYNRALSSALTNPGAPLPREPYGFINAIYVPS